MLATGASTQTHRREHNERNVSFVVLKSASKPRLICVRPYFTLSPSPEPIEEPKLAGEGRGGRRRCREINSKGRRWMKWWASGQAKGRKEDGGRKGGRVGGRIGGGWRGWVNRWWLLVVNIVGGSMCSRRSRSGSLLIMPALLCRPTMNSQFQMNGQEMEKQASGFDAHQIGRAHV